MDTQTGTVRVKRNFPEMLKGGVIMDVVNAEQAKIAEESGASAVMALERVPADIRRDGGVARMSDPELIIEIKEAVTIPVMAKARIGHFVEAEIIQALGVDCIDESEVLTPADETYHINKHDFRIPFVCGARDLGEALRRIGEGAAMIRSKGEAGTGNIVEAVRHLRTITDGIRRLTILPEEELMTEAKNLGAPYELVREVAQRARACPSSLFCAGGIATPADAALVDAPRRRRRLRWQRHLQVRRPAAHRQGDRQGDDPLPGPGDSGRSLARPGRPDARPGAQVHPAGPADGRARLVSPLRFIHDAPPFPSGNGGAPSYREQWALARGFVGLPRA